MGSPLPGGVAVRLVDDDGNEVGDGIPGEIQVCGDTVFAEYWDRPDATTDAFDGPWFRTGDVAVRGGQLSDSGRASVDILKTGGEKVSALRSRRFCWAIPRSPRWRWWACPTRSGVIGWSPPWWLPETHRPGRSQGLRHDRLAPAKVLKEVHLVDSPSRNAMGKVTKPEVVKAVSGPEPERQEIGLLAWTVADHIPSATAWVGVIVTSSSPATDSPCR